MRVLAISAHPDDSDFGCLGTLLKHKEAGDELYFVAFTPGRTLSGYRKMAEFFSSPYTCYEYPDQEFDRYPIKEFISLLEMHRDWFKPDIVYCPFIGDLNRDHRQIAEACMVAFRNGPLNMYYIKGTSDRGLRSMLFDEIVTINQPIKEKLIREWYPNELISGREIIDKEELFEYWPR